MQPDEVLKLFYNLQPPKLNELSEYDICRMDIPSFIEAWRHQAWKGDTTSFYKTYTSEAFRVGGIFNKERGTKYYTIDEFMNQNHSKVNEYIADHEGIKWGTRKGMRHYHENLVNYIGEITKGKYPKFKKPFRADFQDKE